METALRVTAIITGALALTWAAAVFIYDGLFGEFDPSSPPFAWWWPAIAAVAGVALILVGALWRARRRPA